MRYPRPSMVCDGNRQRPYDHDFARISYRPWWLLFLKAIVYKECTNCGERRVSR